MSDFLKDAAVVGGLIGATASLWRWHLIRRRRFEVAEEALTAFLAAKDALEYIRNPAAPGHGRPPRDEEPGESENEARLLDIAYVSMMRCNEVAEKFSALRAIQLLCRQHFGEEAYEAFETLFRVRERVLATARALATTARNGRSMRARGNPDPHMQQRVKEFWLNSRSWEREIWHIDDLDDLISAHVKTAQESLERICVPVLRSRSMFWGNVRDIVARVWDRLCRLPQGLRDTSAAT